MGHAYTADPAGLRAAAARSNMHAMIRLAALTLVCLGTIAHGAHAADVPQFEATGRAPISGGDRVRARQRALDEAFGHAIEGALSATLGPDVLVRRAADLRLK